MQLIVKIPGETQCEEWAIVELQGELETRHSVPLSGKFIGDLHFAHKDAPVLIIGHHILHGKVLKMEKPFAVMMKAPSSTAPVTDGADPTLHTIDTVEETSNLKQTYHVQAIIRKKILFKTRPKPIIAHVPKKL